MVYYRKYRPQKIDDLDSESVRVTLTSILAKEPSHAFLFTGPKGLGKTSAARIIAKVVNCTGRQVNKEQRTKNQEQKNSKSSVQSSKLDAAFIEPCNKCEQCVSITEGSNMDILEIDAASNRGIDEIRDLKEKIRLAPMNSSKKVYIIDEVHMLTTEAFNALLKTLEEPPEHAMFILCTTEPQKVPDTIVSRCFHINFNLATEEEIVHSLKRIIDAEKIKIDEDSLYSIAQMADGGFRDAAKILEEVVLTAPGKITKEVLEKSYKTKSVPLHIANLLATFQADNKKEGIKEGVHIVETIVSQGIDIKSFIAQMLSELNKRVLKEVGIEKKSENEISDDLILDINELKNLAKIFDKVYQETKYSVLPQLPLELAIIELGQTSPRTQEPKSENNEEEPGVSVSTLRKQDGNIKKIKAMYGSSGKTSEKKDLEKLPAHASGELLHTFANGELSKEWMETFWKSIISEMKNYNHTIAGVLRGCRISSFDKKNLVIETGFKFHQERLDDVKTKTELARVAKMLTGKDVTVDVELRRD